MPDKQCDQRSKSYGIATLRQQNKAETKTFLSWFSFATCIFYVINLNGKSYRGIRCKKGLTVGTCDKILSVEFYRIVPQVNSAYQPLAHPC